MKRFIFIVLILRLALTWVAAASFDAREIDGLHSTLTVRVYKSGFLSAFGHNHETQAPVQSGQVKDSGELSVELRVDARKPRVLDPEVSNGTRAQIQETMLGTQVPMQIVFRRFGFNPLEWNQKDRSTGSCMAMWHCTAWTIPLRSR